MFLDLNDVTLQPQSINTEVPEIILSDSIRQKLQHILEQEDNFAIVNAATTVVRPDNNNNVFFSNQWYYLAILCKKYAMALYPYCVFFDNNVRNNQELIKELSEHKVSRLKELFENVDDAKRAFQFIKGDVDFRPGKALINVREGNKIAVRGCKDIFGSCILKKLAVPDASSSYLGNLVYYLAKHKDVYDLLEDEINTILSNPPKPIESPLFSVDHETQNEYECAAEVLKQHLETKGIDFLTEKSDVEKTRDDFIFRFAPEKLSMLKGDDILNNIFYTTGDNSTSLCCWIEMNKECKAHFGSISGGSAYKFGLFQKQENGKWVTGGPLKSKELTHEEALELGTRIRDALVKGAQIIERTDLKSVEDYEKLDGLLEENLNSQNVYYNWAWFHKYFSILFPDKLSSYHNNEWQYHILRSLRIKPSDKYYARSGQIAMVQKYGGWWYRQLADICNDRFGHIKQFLRLGSSDGSKGYASEWKRNSVVGIGWPGIGSLDEYKNEDGGLDKNEIADRLKEVYFPNDARNASRKAGELIRFYEANKDSIILVADGEKLIGLVDDIGAYRYDESTDMPNIRSGVWHCPFDENESLPDKSEGLMTSCIQIKNDDNLMYLYDKYYYGEEGNTDSKEEYYESEVKMKNCLELKLKPRTDKTYPLNVIIYGAPGTGKTYSTAEYAMEIVDGIKYDNRPFMMKMYNELIEKGQIVFTTFHQSYGYEEFIQGLRPDTTSDKMSFNVIDGVFKRIADAALNDSDHNYVIIIDEINRANISKVFGELITLIEEDKRWGEVNQLCATLQSGDVFAVPNNLYIIGTMNSADKSISLIDAALRRRFEFIEQKPDPELITDTMLKGVFVKINTRLASELDSTDLLIGHSYFLGKTKDDLPAILNRSVIPLLYEYFYDNRKKVASVLEEAIKDTNVEIVNETMGRLSVKKK